MSCLRCLDFLWISLGDANKVLGLLCVSLYLVECEHSLALALELMQRFLVNYCRGFSTTGTPSCVIFFKYVEVCMSFFPLGKFVWYWVHLPQIAGASLIVLVSPRVHQVVALRI